METRQPDTLKRGEFIRSLGLSSAALMSFYCLGTLTACSGGGDDDPTPTPTPNPNPGTGLTGNTDPTKGKIDFTLDLTNATYSKLKTAGEFTPVSNIVVANAAGNMVAIGRICTHQGGELSYRKANNDFQCNVHGGLFNTNGSVKAAPPIAAVKSYTVQSGNNGNSLRVFE